MVPFFLFLGVAAIGIIDVVLQNIAIRLLIPKGEPPPEGAILTQGAKAREAVKQRFSPPISILKPLKGLDDDLEANLESFCQQSYPNYEIIFALEEEGDPAGVLARKMKERYPDKEISIVVKKRDYALNPKVDNLISAYEAARYPFFLISDSDVRVPPDYLSELVAPMEDPQVGLVSNLIRGIGTRTFGSLLENLHLNSFVIGHVAIFNRLFNRPTCVGKSMLIRKDVFEQIGGFAAVRNVLAEDYVIGELIDKRGKQVVTSGHLVNALNHYRTFGQFLKRHVRWGKLRRALAGPGYISELLSNTVFVSFLAVILFVAKTKILIAAMAFILAKIGGDFFIGKRIKSAHRFYHYLFVPLKDIIIGIIWFVPFFSRTVTWRRHRYRINKGTVLVPITGGYASG